MSPSERPWEDLRREVERLLGLPFGSSDPLGEALQDLRKDAQRFEQVLGRGFVDAQYLATAIRDRAEAAANFRLPSNLFEIPRRLLQARPPGLNGPRPR